MRGHLAHKSTILFVLLCIATNTQAFQVVSQQNPWRTNLRDLTDLEASAFFSEGCTGDRDTLQQYANDYGYWISAVSEKELIGTTLEILNQVQTLINRAEQSVHSIQSSHNLFIELKNTKVKVKNNIKKLGLSHIGGDWINDQVDNILAYVELLNKAKDSEDKLQLVSTIQNLLLTLIGQVKDMDEQISSVNPDIEELQDQFNTLSQNIDNCDNQGWVAIDTTVELSSEEYSDFSLSGEFSGFTELSEEGAIEILADALVDEEPSEFSEEEDSAICELSSEESYWYEESEELSFSEEDGFISDPIIGVPDFVPEIEPEIEESSYSEEDVFISDPIIGVPDFVPEIEPLIEGSEEQSFSSYMGEESLDFYLQELIQETGTTELLAEFNDNELIQESTETKNLSQQQQDCADDTAVFDNLSEEVIQRGVNVVLEEPENGGPAELSANGIQTIILNNGCCDGTQEVFIIIEESEEEEEETPSSEESIVIELPSEEESGVYLSEEYVSVSEEEAQEISVSEEEAQEVVEEQIELSVPEEVIEWEEVASWFEQESFEETELPEEVSGLFQEASFGGNELFEETAAWEEFEFDDSDHQEEQSVSEEEGASTVIQVETAEENEFEWGFNIQDSEEVEWQFDTFEETAEMEYVIQYYQPEEPSGLIEVNNDGKEDRPFSVDLTDTDETPIQGVTEYSFGMWTRFLYNGANGKVVIKPNWMGLARISTNNDYTDQTKAGDRTLAAFIGKGFYQFSTYDLTSGQNNLFKNIDYKDVLDNVWVFVYFGYSKNSGEAKATLYYAEGLIITESIQADHVPLSDTLHFTAGTANTAANEYSNFNGQLTQVFVATGTGAFFPDEDSFKSIVNLKFPTPELETYEDVEINVQEEKVESDPTEPVGEPFSDDDNSYQTSYSVSLWYRYVKTAKPQFQQTIFRFTTNEADVLLDQNQVGDRTLAVHQDNTQGLEFSTYTVRAKDELQFIHENIALPKHVQQLWTYVWYGYNRETREVRGYVQYIDGDKEITQRALHVAGKHFALYIGGEPFATITKFSGKFSNVILKYGVSSWVPMGTKPSDVNTNYQTGLSTLFPANIQENTEHNSLQDFGSEESQVDVTYEEGGDFIIDGVYEYGYGLWTKYLVYSLDHLLTKPDVIQVARLTDQAENQDMTNPGDRVLTTHIGRGFYQFSTYDSEVVNTYKNIAFETEFEGFWNFIYFGYSKLEQTATAFVLFGTSETLERQQFTVDHNPLNKIIKLYLGKQFAYNGFNGQLQSITLRLGKGAHIGDVASLQTYQLRYPVPQIQQKLVKDIEVAMDQAEHTIEGEAAVFTVPEEDSFEAAEYAVSGWFKFKLGADETRKACHLAFRLTTVPEENLGDTENLGDRTLAALQCTDWQFATYTIGQIDSGASTNKFMNVQSEEYIGFWTYVYMGYNRFDQSVTYFVGFPDISKNGKLSQVVHWVPKYMGLYVARDGKQNGWAGLSKLVQFNVGKGAWIDGSKRNVEQLYPNWYANRLNNQVTIFDATDAEASGSVPQPLNEEGKQPPLRDVIINSNENPELNIEGINEYGFGLWTRWTMTYPRRIIDKSDWHQIIRMTTSTVYQDVAKLGNRVLSVFVGKGYYQYSTYDVARDLALVTGNIDYGQELEGYWNFIYFGYRRTQVEPKAIGYAHYPRISQTKRVEIVNVKHWLLKDYVRILVGAKEFSYLPFNGRFYDLRVFLGPGGFIQTTEELVTNTLPKFRGQPSYVTQLLNIPVVEESMNFESGDGEPDQVDTIYNEKYSGVFEYQLSGWIRWNTNVKMQPLHSVARFTINEPNIQRDYQVTGDRTLAMFISKKAYVYSTYDYGDLERSDDDNEDTTAEFEFADGNFGQWVFMYFGYSFHTKQAYAYLRYLKGENSYTFNVNHFIPNYMRVYLGNDNLYPQMEGLMRAWYLGVGPGAFTLTPYALITTWPIENIPQPDKIMSAILLYQGNNSGKLLRG